MKEFRQSPEKKFTPASESKDILRAAKMQKTREGFSTEWRDTVREHQAASKSSGRDFFKDLYRERYQEDPPGSPEIFQHNVPRPPDLKSYRQSLMDKIHEVEHNETQSIHREYRKLQQKLQNTPLKSLEDVINAYERRYLPYNPTKGGWGIVGITSIKDADEDEIQICHSFLNMHEGSFNVLDLDKKLDQDIGPKEPPALNASNILRYQIKKDLDLVSEDERKNLQLNKIRFISVMSDKMIDASRDFIPSSGKPLTLSHDATGRGRAAFERLMTSPFGKIVSWALKDGRELLKSDKCHAVTISTPHDEMESLWPLELDTGEHTGRPEVLASITYHLK
jgi:hypothetical protein